MHRIFFPSSKPKFVDEEEVIEEFRGLALEVARRNRNVESVYLFGSYAQGNVALHSDADILVVLSQDKRSLMDRLDEFMLEFSNGPVPVDVLVYTRTELDAALKKGNDFLRRAITGIRLA